MAKRGQPTKYRPEFCEMATELLARGYDKVAVAGSFKVSVDTLENWRRQYPEFAEAIDVGEPQRSLYWQEQLIAAANSPPNAKSFQAIWQGLRHSHPSWRDNQPLIAQTNINLLDDPMAFAQDLAFILNNGKAGEARVLDPVDAEFKQLPAPSAFEE